MATPARKMTEIKKKKRVSEHPPTLSRDMHSQSNKNTLSYTKRALTHTHTQHGNMDTVVGLLFLAFDLLQLSVPLE